MLPLARAAVISTRLRVQVLAVELTPQEAHARLQLVAEEARVAQVVDDPRLPVQVVPQQQHRRVLRLRVPRRVRAPALDRGGDAW